MSDIYYLKTLFIDNDSKKMKDILCDLFYNPKELKKYFDDYKTVEEYKTIYDRFYKDMKVYNPKIKISKDLLYLKLGVVKTGATRKDIARIGIKFNDYEIVDFDNMPHEIKDLISLKYHAFMMKKFKKQYIQDMEEYEKEKHEFLRNGKNKRSIKIRLGFDKDDFTMIHF